MTGHAAGGSGSATAWAAAIRRRCCCGRTTQLVLLLSVLLAVGDCLRDPTLPVPITGMHNCLTPIKYVTCTRETRNNFVAGVGISQGTGFGVKYICSDAGINTVLGLGGPFWQENFDMSIPDAPTFPKTADGSPDMRYLMPYGAPISQMIVLHAANPLGAAWGTIPAIIFGYQTQEGLDFSVCGNADYAMFYLYPGRFPPPPTMVTLKAQYSNPLSQQLPNRFLSDFSGKCSQRGAGFLGGDPNRSSKLHLLRTSRVCFAAYEKFVPLCHPQGRAAVRVVGAFNASDYEYRRCFYSKKAGKPGGGGTSWSCALSGTAIATGKYGAIQLGKLGTTLDWTRDPVTGQLKPVTATEVYMGSDPEQAVAAPAPEEPQQGGGAEGRPAA